MPPCPRKITLGASLVLLLAVLVCAPLHAQPREVWERYKIAIIAGDGESPYAKAVEAGAREATLPLEEEYYLAITLDNITVPDPSPQAQRDTLHRAFLDGYDGVIYSSKVRTPLTDEEITFLAKHDIPVVMVDSSIPDASLAAVLTSKEDYVKLAVDTLISHMRNVRDRVGVIYPSSGKLRDASRSEIARRLIEQHPLLEFYVPEPVDASFRSTYPVVVKYTEEDYGDELRGWLFLGNWPLLGGAPMPWKPGEMVCVAMDADPRVIPYLASGQVQAVVAKDYVAKGEKAMQLLIEKIHNQKDPEEKWFYVPPKLITKKNLAEFQTNWTEWLKN